MARVDPALKKLLEERGLTSQLRELQEGSKRASVFRQLIPATKEKVVGFAQATKGFLGTGLGESIGGALASPEIKRQQEEVTKRGLELQDILVEQIRKAQGDPEKLKRLLRISQQIGETDIISQVPELQKTTRETFTDAFQLAALATLGFKPSTLGTKGVTGQLASAKVRALSQLSKEIQAVSAADRVRRFGTVGKLVNKVIPIARESAIGAGFFGGLAAVEGRPKEEVVKQAGFGALVGGGVVAATGLAALGVGKAISALRPSVTKAGQRTIAHLETLAAPTPKVKRIEAAPNEVEKTLAVIPSRFQSFKQGAAQKALSAIDIAKQIPQRLFNRFNSLERAQLSLEQLKGAPLTESEKIGRNARLTAATAAGRAELAIGDFLQGFRQFDDIRDETTAYLLKLDFLDRANLGQKIASGETLVEVRASLAALEQELGNNLPRVRQAQQLYNNFNKSLLQERVDAGLISSKTMDDLLRTHPNYLPHNVVARLDEDIANTFNISDTLNISKTDIQKAVGSLREIEDPITATAQRTQIAFQLIERNKTLTGLVEAQEKFNFVGGMRPIVTAEITLARRKAFEELGLLRAELENIKSSIKIVTKEDKALVTKINKAQGEIDEISEKAINEFLAAGESAEANLISKLVVKTDVRPAQKQLAKEVEGIREQTLILQTTTKERLKVVNKDITEKQNELNARLKKLEAKTVRVSEGEKTTVAAELNAANRAQENLLTTLQEKEFILQQGSVKFLGAPKPQPTVLTELRTDKLNVKQQIDQTIISKNNEKLNKLKEGIATREKKLLSFEAKLAPVEKQLDTLLSDFQTKKNQVSGAIKDLKQIKFEDIKEGEKIINVFRNGIKETWVVPADIELAVKNLEAPKLNALLKILTIPNRLLKAGATRFNLSFALPNKFRDKQTALITADAFIDSIARKTDTSPAQINFSKSELKRLWIESGGSGSSIFKEDGFGILGTKKPPAKVVSDLEKRGLIKQLDTLNPIKIIEAINEQIETSTRLDVFDRALRRGLSPRDAAIVSRDATIDFAKMGTFMRSLNQLIPFLNARVQGFVNLPRALAASPETFARTQLWTAVYPTLGLHQWNRQFESFGNISQWYKDNKWVIMTGEVDGFDERGNPIKIPKFITIPKGEGQQLVSNPVQFFLERADERDFRTVDQMLIDTLGGASPFQFQSFNSSNAFLTGISQLGAVPTIVTGLGTNIKPFTGTPIIPRGREKLVKELQFAKTTPQVVRDLSGIIDVAPAQLEFIFDSFGGLPQDILDGLDVGISAAKGEGLNLKTLEDSPFGQATRIPVLRTFLRETTGFGAPAQQRQAEIKAGIVEEVASEKAVIRDQALELILELNKKNFTKVEEADQFINSKIESGEITQEIVDKAIDIKKRGARVLELTISDPVAVRARVIQKFIDDSIQAGVSSEEIKQTLDLLEEKRILTDSTKEALKVLQR